MQGAVLRIRGCWRYLVGARFPRNGLPPGRRENRLQLWEQSLRQFGGEGVEFGEARGRGFESFFFPDEEFAAVALDADAEVAADQVRGRAVDVEAAGQRWELAARRSSLCGCRYNLRTSGTRRFQSRARAGAGELPVAGVRGPCRFRIAGGLRGAKPVNENNSELRPYDPAARRLLRHARATKRKSTGKIALLRRAGPCHHHAAEDEMVPDSISRRILRRTEASSSRLTWLLRKCTRTWKESSSAR